MSTNRPSQNPAALRSQRRKLLILPRPTLAQICAKVALLRAASARWIFLLLVATALGTAKNRVAPPWEKPLETGRYLFLENCSVCHEINGPKSNKFGPSLFRLFQNEKMPYSGAKPSEEYVANRIKAGGFIMPPFRDTLTDDQIEKVIAYLRSRH